VCVSSQVSRVTSSQVTHRQTDGVVQMASRATLMRLRTRSRSATRTVCRSLVTRGDDDTLTAALTYVMVVSRDVAADAWNSLAPVSSRIRRRFRSVIPPPARAHVNTHRQIPHFTFAQILPVHNGYLCQNLGGKYLCGIYLGETLTGMFQVYAGYLL